VDKGEDNSKKIPTELQESKKLSTPSKGKRQ
jgi:hypothetical protein